MLQTSLPTRPAYIEQLKSPAVAYFRISAKQEEAAPLQGAINKIYNNVSAINSEIADSRARVHALYPSLFSDEQQ